MNFAQKNSACAAIFICTFITSNRFDYGPNCVMLFALYEREKN
jgi:hypothetical protein